MLNVLLLVGSYLLGAIPFGVIVAKSMGVDIMAVGSKNIGATNVSRVLGPKAGALVLILDVMKGLVPAAGAYTVLKSHDWAMFAGIAAVLGHMFSPFLKFKGGKGIATTLGAMIGALPIVAGIALGVFIVLFAITRYVSVAAIVAAIVAVAACFWSGVSGPVQVIVTLLGAIILLKHIPNMKRLASGTEPKFSFKKSDTEPHGAASAAGEKQ